MNETFDGPFSLVQMLLGSLSARPMRSLLSILAISIQVVLVLLIVGLTSGVVSEWGKRVEGVGADLLVRPPNSSIFFAFTSAVMQENSGDQIASLPGVDEVAPTLILTDPKNLMIIYGIDYKRFNALSRGFLFRDGRPFAAPDEAIADDIIAQARHLKVGDRVTLMNRDFTVAGIVAHGKGTRAQILKLMPQSTVFSLPEYVSLMSSANLPQLRPFTRSMVGLGIIISFLVVLLNMHTMVMERTREIGILKALGFSRFDVVRMLLGETLFIALLGICLGILITFFVQAVLKQTSPGLTVLISSRWIFSAAGLALVGAAAGAIYPAARAANSDPVVALAYE